MNEIKPQPLRLYDFLILAPVLYYAGTREKKLPSWTKSFLVASAVGIFVYEMKNFLEIQRIEQGGVAQTSLPQLPNSKPSWG